MEKIAQGAEAVIYAGKHIKKVRKKKGYRLPELDKSIRKSRTKREAKVLERLSPFGFVPGLLDVDAEKGIIVMERIAGDRLSECLEKTSYREICEKIGECAAMMHNKGIIHGDLTTSNIILDKNSSIRVIDFGLSFFSEKAEDRAVDIHVFKEALEAKHPSIWKQAFESFIKGYRRKTPEAESVLKRLAQVEERGRYKGKS